MIRKRSIHAASYLASMTWHHFYPFFNCRTTSRPCTWPRSLRHSACRFKEMSLVGMALKDWTRCRWQRWPRWDGRKQKTPGVHGGDTYVYAVYVSNISTAYLLWHEIMEIHGDSIFWFLTNAVTKLMFQLWIGEMTSESLPSKLIARPIIVLHWVPNQWESVCYKRNSGSYSKCSPRKLQ